MKTFLFSICFAFMIACAPASHEPNDCEIHLYDSGALHPSGIANGYLPVCDRLLDRFGCETFEDYNNDGVDDIQDLLDFCRIEHGGDTLTMDLNRPWVEGERRQWCFVCD